MAVTLYLINAERILKMYNTLVTHPLWVFKVVMILSILFTFGVSTKAQAVQPIYALVSGSDGYKIIQVNLDANQTVQPIYSVPSVSDKTLSNDPLLASEAQFAQKVFSEYPSFFPKLTIENVLNVSLSANVNSFSISPDGTQIALPVSYSACFSSPTGTAPECFGAFTIFLISVSDHTSKVIAELPYHALDYLPAECQLNQNGNLDSQFFHLELSDIKWLKTNTSLIASIRSVTDTNICPAYFPNETMLVWASTTGMTKSLFIDSSLTWDLDLNTSTLDYVQGDCTIRPGGLCAENLVRMQLSDDGHAISKSSQSLSYLRNPGDPIISLSNGNIAYIGYMLASGVSDNVPGGIVIVPSDGSSSYLMEKWSDFTNGIIKIKASTDQTSIVFQDGAKRLWIIDVLNPKPILLSENPVTFWNITNEGVIVQFSGQSSFSVFNHKGEQLSQLDILPKLNQENIVGEQPTIVQLSSH